MRISCECYNGAAIGYAEGTTMVDNKKVPRLSVGVRKMLWEIFCASFMSSAKWLDDYRTPVMGSGEALAALKGEEVTAFWHEVIRVLRIDSGGRANDAKIVFQKAAELVGNDAAE